MMYGFLKGIGQVLFRLIFFMSSKKFGDVPVEGPCIVAANHISMIDPVFIGLCIKRRISFMAKEELFRGKKSTFMLKHLGAFPVKRGERDMGAVRTCLETINRGEVLGIFPEGTRVTADMRDVRIKRGVALFAYKTHCPVLPVSVRTKNNTVRPFRRVRVVFGELMTFESLGFTDGSSADLHRVSENIMARVKELADRDADFGSLS